MNCIPVWLPIKFHLVCLTLPVWLSQHKYRISSRLVMLIKSAQACTFEHTNDIMPRCFLKKNFNQEGISTFWMNVTRKGSVEEGHFRVARRQKAGTNTCLQFDWKEVGGGWVCNLGSDGWLASWQGNTALFFRSMWYWAYMNLCKELAQVLTFLTIGWRLF